MRPVNVDAPGNRPSPSTLLRPPAVQTPAPGASEPAPQIRVTGVLTQDAELRMTTGAQPHGLLFLRIAQSAGLPYEARQDCGSEPAQLIAAEAKRRVLKRGAVVTIYASGITPRTDHAHAVLALRGVTDVVPAVTHRHND